MDTQEVEKRVAEARRLHKQGYNCCQSVVLAYADILPIGKDIATNLAAPFGRGLSGMREVCGCVSGMSIVCGLCGKQQEVRTLAEKFKTNNGDINCGRLLQQGKRPCPEMVAYAAKILGENL